MGQADHRGKLASVTESKTMKGAIKVPMRADSDEIPRPLPVAQGGKSSSDET